jgi:O-acetyl-ADP-ribose deacetylase (regulator of RNase III)
MTRGYRLPAKHVIHTPGPVWHGGGNGEDELLAQCYRNSLALVSDHGLKSVAFPAISCGIYGYPIDRAAAIAVREIRSFLTANSEVERVVVVCFGGGVYDAYCEVLQGLVPEQ